VQPETEIEAPSVRETVAAMERLRLSEEIRQDVPGHTYPLRDEDLETVERFYDAFGELPPAGYLRSLWWHLRS
jgi:hypothetical protein